ncbi:MAG TPA: hypothetical protein VM537_24290 [Anaerolineae bacterium]|nr:hypothetical protein [Anaerolineae bacterium]
MTGEQVVSMLERVEFERAVMADPDADRNRPRAYLYGKPIETIEQYQDALNLAWHIIEDLRKAHDHDLDMLLGYH